MTKIDEEIAKLEQQREYEIASLKQQKQAAAEIEKLLVEYSSLQTEYKEMSESYGKKIDVLKGSILKKRNTINEELWPELHKELEKIEPSSAMVKSIASVAKMAVAMGKVSSSRPKAE